VGVNFSVNELNENKPEKQTENFADENAVFEECGKFGAYKFGERYLCADCYQSAGSCCSTESKDDGE
jgi:hypothetical protein